MERKALTMMKLGILFSFWHFNIGRVDLLPDFVGMLLFFAAVRCHKRMTDVERRMQPLLLLLAADFFLHWVFPFENTVESLIVMIVFLYVTFVLLGEVMERIRPYAPDAATRLGWLRVSMVVIQTASFLLQAYGNETINGIIVALTLLLLIVGMIVLCMIPPMPEE